MCSMADQFILTPFYIDKSLTGLKEYAGPDWWRNDAPLPVGSPQYRLVQLYRPLRELVAKALERGFRPVTIAGDCCTSLGVLAGLQKAGIDPTLLWLDAHGDFNTWETTPSGFLGGMPLAMLVGRGEQTIADGLGLQTLAEDRVILCDGRDLDPEEKAALDGSAINCYSSLPDSTDFLPAAGPIYIHFDTDFIDPTDAPAMNYPSPGGPPLNRINSFFEVLAETGRIAAVSVSSWNPSLDSDGRTGRVVFLFLKVFLG
jgi:arginase